MVYDYVSYFSIGNSFHSFALSVGVYLLAGNTDSSENLDLNVCTRWNRGIELERTRSGGDSGLQAVAC